MNWPQVRQRYERWFQGWLVLAPIVGFGSTTWSRINFTAFGR